MDLSRLSVTALEKSCASKQVTVTFLWGSEPPQDQKYCLFLEYTISILRYKHAYK